MPDYDVVVVGAGNAGLTGAATLAKAGRKVLLLERHNVPGGCATSFVRGRFEFEMMLDARIGCGVDEQHAAVSLGQNDGKVAGDGAFARGLFGAGHADGRGLIGCAGREQRQVKAAVCLGFR